MKTVFVTHGFRFHKPWKELNTLIEKNLTEKYLNVSVPWHDPSFLPYDAWGKAMIDDSLKSQVTNVDVFVIIQSLLESKSARNYVLRQIEIAMHTNEDCKIISYCNSERHKYDNTIDAYVESPQNCMRIKEGVRCSSSMQVIAAIAMQ